MRIVGIIATILVFLAMTLPANSSSASSSDELSAKARKLHFTSIVVDTHDDTTQRLIWQHLDLGRRDPDGAIDIPRMREGGLGAIFFSIWMPGKVTGPLAIRNSLDARFASRCACIPGNWRFALPLPIYVSRIWRGRLPS